MTDLKTVMQEAHALFQTIEIHLLNDDPDAIEAGDVERMMAKLAAALAELEKAEPVHQFRRECCSDWYDGLPDETDGRGPYETRTLFTHPAPSAAPQPAQPRTLNGLTEAEICATASVSGLASSIPPAMVPLSDEQIGDVLANDYESAVDIAHAVIAKFCEVNGIAQPGEPT